MKMDIQRRHRYTTIVLCLFAAIATVYLITEHRPHLFGWLPYLILLACPLMHLFMHHSHGNQAKIEDSAAQPSRASHDSGAHH